MVRMADRLGVQAWKSLHVAINDIEDAVRELNGLPGWRRTSNPRSWDHDNLCRAAKLRAKGVAKEIFANVDFWPEDVEPTMGRLYDIRDRLRATIEHEKLKVHPSGRVRVKVDDKKLREWKEVAKRGAAAWDKVYKDGKM